MRPVPILREKTLLRRNNPIKAIHIIACIGSRPRKHHSWPSDGQSVATKNDFVCHFPFWMAVHDNEVHHFQSPSHVAIPSRTGKEAPHTEIGRTQPMHR
jgi:hypothetical protein